MKRDLVSIDDLSTEELDALFRVADEMAARPGEWSHLLRGRILASLFYEPSTRTRLSFESAMHRLGGDVLSAPDMRLSSAAKGETLADTVRVVGGAYADVLVIRHPCEGSARVAARYASVPVVNAGDGSHEHPTQTICDLDLLRARRGRLRGLDVVLCGDLKYSRTIHSFAYALARFGANLLLVPYRGFEMPAYVLERLRERYGKEAQHLAVGEFAAIADRVDAAYFTPERPHQLSLFTEGAGAAVAKFDALYVTRPQRERHGEGEGTGRFPRIARDTLVGERFRDTVVMHPLPRTEEIGHEFDADPRSVYFQQAARGVPVRMAILAFLLGAIDLGVRGPRKKEGKGAALVRGRDAFRCRNPACISQVEGHYVEPEFRLIARVPLAVACAYCETRASASLVGCSRSRVFHRHNSADARRILPEHLVLFDSEEDARRSGYVAAQRS